MTDTFDQQTFAPDTVNSSTDSGLQLRAAASGDEPFLINLFATTRSDELAALAWNPAQAEMFIAMQYRAQLQNYQATYPEAENKIILLNDQPVGRILVDRGAAEFLLVDISLLPEHRNAGTGGGLIRDLLLEAAAASKPVKLYVVNYNPARRLYDRLGFSPIADDGMYVEMMWSNPS